MIVYQRRLMIGGIGPYGSGNNSAAQKAHEYQVYKSITENTGVSEKYVYIYCSRIIGNTPSLYFTAVFDIIFSAV